MGKPIEELTLMNDFMFVEVMRQERYCKPLLEYILKVKIRAIEYIGYQETIQPPSPAAKSIRLDVFVEDDQNTVYDIEVQTTNKYNLGKRTRYYQSMMDIMVLNRGAKYNELKKSFIIFICNYDPFHSSRYVYTFRTRCDEVPDEVLKDEATKIIINTKGTVGDISDDLKAVIQYLNSGIPSNEYTEELDAEVQSVKANEKVRMSYMLYQEALAMADQYGRYKSKVELIRYNMNEFSSSDLAKIMRVSLDICKSVIETIQSHPDWNDEQVAEEIYWEE